MAKTICVSNQKGGVGKTTTVQAMVSELTLQGKRVLAIDLDPQSNLSLAMGAQWDKPTIYDVLMGSAEISAAIQHTEQGDLLTANILLASLEATFFSRPGKDFVLKKLLGPILADYDFILLDTPPSLGLLLVLALTAADLVIIPLAATIFALQGMAQLLKTIADAKEYCNPELQVGGILITRFDNRTKVAKEMVSTIGNFASVNGIDLFETFIRSSCAVEEAQMQGINLQTYTKRPGVITAKDDYAKFIEEWLGE